MLSTPRNADGNCCVWLGQCGLKESRARRQGEQAEEEGEQAATAAAEEEEAASDGRRQQAAQSDPRAARAREGGRQRLGTTGTPRYRTDGHNA